MEDYCAKSHTTVPESNGAVEDLVIKQHQIIAFKKMLSKMEMIDN